LLLVVSAKVLIWIVSCQFTEFNPLITINNFCFSSPSFTDLWGYTIDWFDEEEGWDHMRRVELLKLHEKNLSQPKALIC